MGLKNGLIFGGINSLDYGIYISGEAVFNAPSRKVDLIQIPGRNGDFALDHGRFENIEVSYPAGTFGDNQTDFREKLSDFRNAILSQVGYQRLTDTYHPDEYRMGVYASGLEVDPVHYNTAGEFVLTFNCKPQRWTTSGETAVAITSGDDITNPTLFDAEPLLAVKGYGGISFNGYTIDLENAVIGDIDIADGDTFTTSKTYTFNTGAFNNGDLISINGSFLAGGKITPTQVARPVHVSSQSSTDSNANFSTAAPTFTDNTTGPTSSIFTSFSETLTVGTNATITNTAAITASGTVTGYGSYTCTWTMVQTITFDAAAGTIDVAMSFTTSSNNNDVHATRSTTATGTISISGYSTITALGNPTYIDCAIGECWMESGGEIISLNRAVDLGSDLPKLAPGANAVTFDGTITELKITPRWWKV